jgi:hypothetical protein
MTPYSKTIAFRTILSVTSRGNLVLNAETVTGLFRKSSSRNWVIGIIWVPYSDSGSNIPMSTIS